MKKIKLKRINRIRTEQKIKSEQKVKEIKQDFGTYVPP